MIYEMTHKEWKLVEDRLGLESDLKPGDYVLTEDYIYKIRNPHSWDSSEKEGILYTDSTYFPDLKNFLKDYLYEHGMKQSETGRFMMDSGAMIRELVEIRQALKSHTHFLAEEVKDFMRELYSKKGKVEGFSLHE